MKDYKPTEKEIEQGYYTDDSESGFCLECNDHSSFDVLLEENGDELGEEVSSCCGGKIYRY